MTHVLDLPDGEWIILMSLCHVTSNVVALLGMGLAIGHWTGEAVFGIGIVCLGVATEGALVRQNSVADLALEEGFV